ncbi:MAG TPA: peptidylprolyl isomerase [Longilinea sp.]|nr:peptidylprolyl isomerase [Longilinea sp.]
MAKTDSTTKIVTKKHQARLDREKTQRRYVLLGTIVVAVLVIMTIGYGILDSLYLKEVRPVAKVDGQSITARDFVGQVRYQRYTLVNQVVQLSQFGEYFQQNIQQANAYLDNPEYLGQQILDRMINDVVIAKEAKARNVSVSDAELEKELEAGFAYYPDGTATPTVTPTAFATGTPGPTQMALIPPTATPSPTNTPTEPIATATPTIEPTATVAGPTTTIEPTWTPFPTPTEITQDGYKTLYSDYVKQLATVNISERTLRNLYRADLLQKKLFAVITADIAPIQEQVWARHILVATEDEAKAVLDRLNKGEDWSKIAAEVSIDTSNNTTGGDLGWFPRGIMVKEFEDAAFSLSIGEISQPVKTDNGYHIIQVIDHQQDRPLTTSILDQAKQSAWSKWLTDVKATMKIETFDLWKEVNPTEPTVPVS